METKPEPMLLTSKELAAMLNVSEKFIEAHRKRIVGSVKIGRLWRFQAIEIKKRIALGKNILN